MSTAPVKSWQGQDVDATTIESQVGRLWTELVRPTGTTSATRTHLYNLVVYAGDRERAANLIHILDRLASSHPSRAIVLIANRSGTTTTVDADVTVQCLAGAGGGAHLCHEQIVVTGHGRAADHLNSVVLPLISPELRTYLWWPGQPPFGQRTFHQLLSLSDQFVVDSGEFTSPGDGLANLSLMCRHSGVNDFQWTRLTAWREVIAQFFDGSTWARYARSIRKISLHFGQGDAEHAAAALLLILGWMANQLDWEVESALEGIPSSHQTMSVISGERVIPIDISLIKECDAMRGRMVRFEAVSQPRDEPPARFIIERSAEANHITARTVVHEGADVSRVIPLNIRSVEDLLAYELSLAGHDPLYERAVQKASQLAGRELWLMR